jgi:hydroxymethylbilane synthase
VLPAGATSLSLEDVVAILGQAPRIGTSSVRRSAQLGRLFPGASFRPIRGNLDTRLRKVDTGDIDAIVLAAAGLRRLAQAHRISAVLPVAACVPAPGQGIIAIEIRGSDAPVREALRAIDDPPARLALEAERIVVMELGGGCQMPIGALAAVDEEAIELSAVVLSLDGASAVRADVKGARIAAADVGRLAAARLLEQGAAEILAEVSRAHGTVDGIQP